MPPGLRFSLSSRMSRWLRRTASARASAIFSLVAEDGKRLGLLPVPVEEGWRKSGLGVCAKLTFPGLELGLVPVAESDGRLTLSVRGVFSLFG